MCVFLFGCLVTSLWSILMLWFKDQDVLFSIFVLLTVQVKIKMVESSRYTFILSAVVKKEFYPL